MSATRSEHGETKPAIPLDLESALASISGLNIKALRKLWQQWFGDPAPRCQSKDVLRRLLAWRAQAERFGGLTRDAKRRLKELAGLRDDNATAISAAPVLKPGTMLTREWRGVVHRVHVLEDGFAMNGRRYASLSIVARTITGARWSGPRFFGLRGVIGAGTGRDR